MSKSINSYNGTEDRLLPVDHQLNSDTEDVENAPTARKQLRNSANNAADEQSSKEFNGVSTVERTPDLQDQLKTSSDTDIPLGCSRVESLKTKQALGYTR